ncbi:MAG: 7-cyano-7-deazaguanine synthase QueC [Candidatus Thermoplasmatota archaeon]|jgi:7-cyano-7-deazaguanine synthase|nr:7-cyano-7-deazaguanine synthase QueC [Candidatus Thermoplasmatota archaeon]MCL5962798.1 7-cyano-7-deazaguanine synthase QueC [Candidatus Thermoplasmatota archaeon]
MKEKVVTLLSGGLDSSTLLAYLIDNGYEPYVITFEYGQIHEKEIISAVAIARHYGIKNHKIIKINMKDIAKSALLDRNTGIPMDRYVMNEIPVTYVPARNIVFLSIALSYAESENIENIAIGANAIDYSGYPDCREDFFKLFEEMANEGTKMGLSYGNIEIMRPFIHMSKKDIVLLGNSLHLPFEKTWSCYNGNEKPCMHCDSCILRSKGFKEANVTDPLV